MVAHSDALFKPQPFEKIAQLAEANAAAVPLRILARSASYFATLPIYLSRA